MRFVPRGTRDSRHPTQEFAIGSIRIDRGLAGTTPLGAPKEVVSAFRAIVPFLFFLDPPVSSEGSAERNGPHDHLFAYLNGEGFDELAWEIATLVTAFVALSLRARPYRASPAILESHRSKATLAGDLLRTAPINRSELLFEFLVSLTVRYVNPAHTTVKAAWRQQRLVDHGTSSLA